jgi:hypothetical protein
MDRPERKKSAALLLDRQAAADPIATTDKRNPKMIAPSKKDIFNIAHIPFTDPRVR